MHRNFEVRGESERQPGEEKEKWARGGDWWIKAFIFRSLRPVSLSKPPTQSLGGISPSQPLCSSHRPPSSLHARGWKRTPGLLSGPTSSTGSIRKFCRWFRTFCKSSTQFFFDLTNFRLVPDPPSFLGVPALFSWVSFLIFERFISLLSFPFFSLPLFPPSLLAFLPSFL